MTLARRLLIVATDHRFSQSVQTHLHKTFLLTSPVVRYDDVLHLATRDSDGLLLFLAAEPEDAERIEVIVRDLTIQQFPTKLAMLQTEEFVAVRKFDPFNVPLPDRFVWPQQTKELNTWVKRTITEGLPFVDLANESARDSLRRKLLAATPSLAPLAEQLAIAAGHEVTVLIEGETGSGKSHLARLIHESSARSAQRFQTVACGAMSGVAMASELFGHTKGSFTGADTHKVGKLAATGSGTLLLDEIDSLGLEHQAHLLRVIETGEFEPVGSHDTFTSQARIIAASNARSAETFTIACKCSRFTCRHCATGRATSRRLSATWSHATATSSGKKSSPFIPTRLPPSKRFPGRATFANSKTSSSRRSCPRPAPNCVSSTCRSLSACRHRRRICPRRGALPIP
jgi:DNA-binding NtrC family response regulator